MSSSDLLFSDEELPVIRQRLKGPRGRKMLEHAIGYCQRYLDPSDSIYFDFQERRNDYWRQRNGVFFVPSHMCALALVGRIAERQDFLEAARDALLTVIENNLADQPDPAKKHAPRFYAGWRRNINHDAGKYFFTLGFLLHTLRDVLNPQQRKIIVEHANETMRTASEVYAEGATLQGLDNNRGGRFVTGLGVLAAAIEHEPGVDAALAKAIADQAPGLLEKMLRWSFGYDGESYEGNAYGPSALVFYLLCAEVHARCGRRDLRGDRRFTEFADFLAYEFINADRSFNNQNDCNTTMSVQALIWAGCRQRHPVALWLWDQTVGCDDHPKCITSPNAHATDHSAVPWSLLWFDDEAEAASPTASGYPLDKHFRERGFVAMRTGWEPDSLHTTIFSGRHGHTAHCHHDLNQVTLYALGERFIVDLGYWVEDPDTGEKQRGWPAEAHNLVSMDSQFQRGRHTRDWAEGYIQTFDHCNEYAYTVGEVSEAYEGVSHCTRHLLLSRQPDTDPYAIWIDNVVPEKADVEHEYVLYLHTSPQNRFRIEDSTAVIQGPRAELDIHIPTPQAARMSTSSFGPYPRLEIAMRGKLGRFALLMHPRLAGQPHATADAQWMDDQVTMAVNLGNAEHHYHFDLVKYRVHQGRSADDIKPHVSTVG